MSVHSLTWSDRRYYLELETDRVYYLKKLPDGSFTEMPVHVEIANHVRNLMKESLAIGYQTPEGNWVAKRSRNHEDAIKEAKKRWGPKGEAYAVGWKCEDRACIDPSCIKEYRVGHAGIVEGSSTASYHDAFLDATRRHRDANPEPETFPECPPPT